MDGWMDGWMDGLDRCVYLFVCGNIHLVMHYLFKSTWRNDGYEKNEE